MATAKDPITVSGLREFRRQLTELGDVFAGRALRLAHNRAAEVVAGAARPGVPTRRGRAAASVRATSGQLESKVSGGGARVPYYPWLDFGGRVGRLRSVKRAFHRGGRYIYPAYASKRELVEAELLAALVEAAEHVGLKVEQ